MNKIKTVAPIILILQQPEGVDGPVRPRHDGLPPPPDAVVHSGPGLVAGAAGGQGGGAVPPVVLHQAQRPRHRVRDAEHSGGGAQP